MADFARPDLLVTVVYKTLADDTPTDVTGQLLKHRIKGGPASGVEVTLTRTAAVRHRHAAVDQLMAISGQSARYLAIVASSSVE